MTDKSVKSCPTPESILKEFVERRKHRLKAEEHVLESILKEKDPSCSLYILSQIKELFGEEISLNKLVEESIERMIYEQEHKPPAGGWTVPEREAGILREHLRTMDRAVSKEALDSKLNEGLHRSQEIYKGKINMQEMWRKRLYAQRDKVLAKLKR